MNREKFASGEVYHIYNRGVDKRNVFSDRNDVLRFLEGMKEFNCVDPIGSLYQKSFQKNKPNGKLSGETAKLVKIISYCLNQNHFHFILEQESDGGVSEFMKRLLGGYTGYFNHKDKRSGSLFQGVFKSKHVHSNEYLLHLSAYVNLNNRVHGLEEEDDLFRSNERSSWREYIGKGNFCSKEKVLGQFRTVKNYKTFAENSLQGILERRGVKYNEMKSLLLE